MPFSMVLWFYSFKIQQFKLTSQRGINFVNIKEKNMLRNLNFFFAETHFIRNEAEEKEKKIIDHNMFNRYVERAGNVFRKLLSYFRCCINDIVCIFPNIFPFLRLFDSNKTIAIKSLHIKDSKTHLTMFLFSAKTTCMQVSFVQVCMLSILHSSEMEIKILSLWLTQKLRLEKWDANE